MLFIPVAPSEQVRARLRDVSISRPGLKMSLFVAPGAPRTELETAVATCWDGRPREMSPVLLQAVLRHVRSSAIELLELHGRGRTSPGLACFAVLDGSVHEDCWIELPAQAPTVVRVGPRFHLAPLEPHEVDIVARSEPKPERALVLA